MTSNLSFVLLIGLVIAARLIELRVAKKNEAWLRENGAVEYGQGHYPFIVALHTLFILSMIVEYFMRGDAVINYLFLSTFMVLILLKIWTISSLGKYWNTKILRVPNSVFIKRGPYKYFRHPNYFIVISEIAVIPLVFGLFCTAIVFTVLNGVMLTVRIKAEGKVWKDN